MAAVQRVVEHYACCAEVEQDLAASKCSVYPESMYQVRAITHSDFLLADESCNCVCTLFS